MKARAREAPMIASKSTCAHPCREKDAGPQQAQKEKRFDCSENVETSVLVALFLLMALFPPGNAL